MDDPTERDGGGDGGNRVGSPPNDAEVIARSLVVRGRVQGVFFRASTEQVAARHGVAGWATNQDDGSVELWLEGTPRAVAAVEAWVRDGGPDAAIVDGVEAADQPVAGHGGFRIR